MLFLFVSNSLPSIWYSNEYFIEIFINILWEGVSSLPANFTSTLPDRLYSALKISSNTRDQFNRYVCCPTRHSLPLFIPRLWSSWRMIRWNPKPVHLFDSLLTTHPQRRHTLCYIISTSCILLYCYKSIKESLQEMLERPNFNQKRFRCAHWCVWWRDLERIFAAWWCAVSEYYSKYFANVDWFKYTQHSEGAMYLTIMNLPWKERYLQENIFLIGVILRPSEPSLHINTFGDWVKAALKGGTFKKFFWSSSANKSGFALL